MTTLLDRAAHARRLRPEPVPEPETDIGMDAAAPRGWRVRMDGVEYGERVEASHWLAAPDHLALRVVLLVGPFDVWDDERYRQWWIDALREVAPVGVRIVDERAQEETHDAPPLSEP